MPLRDVDLTYPDPVGRIFNRVISDISVILWDNTLIISDSIEKDSPVETEIVRVLSLSTPEITEVTRFKKMKERKKKKKTIFRVGLP